MARYIDADKIDFSPLKDDFDRARAKVIIMGQPAAEVVPKSEVERLYEVIFKKEDLMQKIAKERNDYYDELQKAKSEVEKIFDEIERLSLSTVDDWCNCIRIISDNDYSELKKKYTEGENDQKKD